MQEFERATADLFSHAPEPLIGEARTTGPHATGGDRIPSSTDMGADMHESRENLCGVAT